MKNCVCFPYFIIPYYKKPYSIINSLIIHYYINNKLQKIILFTQKYAPLKMPTQNVKNLIKDKLNAIPLLYHITKYILVFFSIKKQGILLFLISTLHLLIRK